MFVAFLLPSVLSGQEAVPLDKQVDLLLKAISYDRNLEKRTQGTIHIGVIHQQGAEAADGIAAAFNAADQVKQLTVEAKSISFISVKALLELVDEKGFNVFFVHSSAGRALSSIQQVTRGKKILSLAGDRQQVERGLALGVYLNKGVPRLVVNQRAAQIEGLDLAPAIRLISTTLK